MAEKVAAKLHDQSLALTGSIHAMSQPEAFKSEPTPAAGEPFRWRRLLQYKLRTLLFVVIPLCAAFFAWWSYRAHEQRAAVAALKKISGSQFVYDFQQVAIVNRSPVPTGPAFWPTWLVNLLGVDYFANVEGVLIPEAKDADLELLQGLPALTDLNIAHSTVTDSGLVHLQRVRKLQSLSIDSTQVTDAGLKHLKGLTVLNELDLGHTKITDAGLEHLMCLPALQHLYLTHTKVSDDGVARLKQWRPNCNIVNLGKQHWPLP